MTRASPFSRIVLALTLFFSVAVLLSLPLAAAPEASRKNPQVSASVVISEFRSRGPVGANDEFIELFNPTNKSVDITGWKIRRSSSSGTTSAHHTIGSVVLSPGQHFLITNNNTSNPYSGAVAGDEAYGTGFADNGGIALLLADGATIVDAVGMSTNAAYREGTILAPLTTSVEQSYERKPGGVSGNCYDTEDNATDFIHNSGTSNPQNLASALTFCAGVETATPTPTPTQTDTPNPSATATPTETFTPTDTPTNTQTYTSTCTPSDTPTETFTPTDTATATSTYTATSTPTAPAHIVISEFCSRGPVGANDEFIELFNPTNKSIDITGWKIRRSSSSGTTSAHHTIGSVVLAPGQHFLITNNNASNPYSGAVAGDETYGTGFADNGGIALLLADGATIVDAVGMSTNAAYREGTILAPLTTSVEQSYERKPGGASGNCYDTDDNATDFIHNSGTSNPQNLASALTFCAGVETATPTPTPTQTDTPNPSASPTATATLTATPTQTAPVTFTPTQTYTPAPGGLFINEFMPAPAQDWNGDTLADDNDEWIEIFNANAFAVNLDGWMVDDVANGGSTPHVLSGVTVAAHSFVLLFRADTGIALNNTNDDVRLLKPDASAADTIAYKSSASNATWSRVPDGANYFALYCPPTPNASNCSIAATPTLTPTPFAQNIFINEFLPVAYKDWNSDGVLDAGDEWIEIYNASARAIDLSGWKLDDAKNGSAPYTFPDGTVLNASSFLVVYANTSGVGLNNDGDTVRLLHPDETIADKYTYAPLETNKSYARLPDGGDTWATHCIPTPNARNCSVTIPPTPTRVFNLTTIAHARTLPVGVRVSLLGSVIAHPCELDLYGHEMMLSDGSAGIAVYMGYPARMSCLIPRNEQVVVTGVISDHYGLRTIYPASNLELARHYDAPREIVPRAIHTGSIDKNVEAMLVTIQGKVSNGMNGDTLWVNDGTGAIAVRADEYSRASFEGITRGSLVRITGVVYPFNVLDYKQQGYVVRVRARNDVTVLELAEKLPEAPSKRGGVDLGAVSIQQALATKPQNYVTLGGVVTLPPGIMDERDFWMQDASGGIHIFVANSAGALPPMRLLDNVSVRGRVVNAFGAREIRVELPDAIGVHGAGAPPNPRVLKTVQVDLAYEGMVVQITGWVARADGRSIYIDDGSGEVLVYLDADTRIRWRRLHAGDPARIIGVVNRFRGAPEILPRAQSDVQFGALLLPIAGADAPTFLNQMRARGSIGIVLHTTRKLRARAAHGIADIYSPRAKRAYAPETRVPAPPLWVTGASLLLLCASALCGVMAAHKYRRARVGKK